MCATIHSMPLDAMRPSGTPNSLISQSSLSFFSKQLFQILSNFLKLLALPPPSSGIAIYVFSSHSYCPTLPTFFISIESCLCPNKNKNENKNCISKLIPSFLSSSHPLELLPYFSPPFS